MAGYSEQLEAEIAAALENMALTALDVIKVMGDILKAEQKKKAAEKAQRANATLAVRGARKIRKTFTPSLQNKQADADNLNTAIVLLDSQAKAIENNTANISKRQKLKRNSNEQSAALSGSEMAYEEALKEQQAFESQLVLEAKDEQELNAKLKGLVKQISELKKEVKTPDEVKRLIAEKRKEIKKEESDMQRFMQRIGKDLDPNAVDYDLKLVDSQWDKINKLQAEIIALEGYKPEPIKAKIDQLEKERLAGAREYNEKYSSTKKQASKEKLQGLKDKTKKAEKAVQSKENRVHNTVQTYGATFVDHDISNTVASTLTRAENITDPDIKAMLQKGAEQIKTIAQEKSMDAPEIRRKQPGKD